MNCLICNLEMLITNTDMLRPEPTSYHYCNNCAPNKFKRICYYEYLKRMDHNFHQIIFSHVGKRFTLNIGKDKAQYIVNGSEFLVIKNNNLNVHELIIDFKTKVEESLLFGE